MKIPPVSGGTLEMKLVAALRQDVGKPEAMSYFGQPVCSSTDCQTLH
jgi:hypothetical protein